MSSYRCGLNPGAPWNDSRVCSFQQGYIFMPEDCPNVNFMAHDTTKGSTLHQFVLSKIIFGIKDGDGISWLLPGAAGDFVCDNIPGGLKGTGTYKGIKCTVEAYPRILGREPLKRIGGIVVKATLSEPADFVIKIGGGNYSCLHGIHGILASGDINGEKCSIEMTAGADNTITITSEEHKLFTICRAESKWEIADNGENGQYCLTEKTGSEFYVICSFSEDKGESEELTGADMISELERVKDYYRRMLDNWYIKTPCDTIDETFAHARLNVEYSWMRPYGWIECIHHWPTMWHMEHTAMEEWAGNSDRTKELLRSQMKNLFPNGAVPDMCPGGTGRREWGGNNQFFFREVMHYLEMTGDLDFAKEVEPYMDKILAQTFREYDPLKNGVLGWGTQIGNQEDFESTPGMGSGTGCEGARMLEIMSEIKLLNGKREESDFYRRASENALARTKKELWQSDLGRFAWYRDSNDNVHLDTSYHGIVYPVIYGQLSDADAVSSMDHLKHRMTGKSGEMYQSNHFGEHAYWGLPTWGMQCGSNMQPFATAAYARLGMNNDAIRPMKFIADIVAGPYQRGSFPETANEFQHAYFYPSAAVYGEQIIESIFGAKLNMLKNVMHFSPCFPDDWNSAELKLPSLEMRFERAGSKQIFRCRLKEKMPCAFTVKTPPCENVTAVANGVPAEIKTVQHIGFFEHTAQLGEQTEFVFEFCCDPIDFNVQYKKSVAAGDKFSISACGAELVSIDDKCGCFSGYRMLSESGAELSVKSDALDKYEKFGWFGMVNFARRCFTVKLRHNVTVFEIPCRITLVPRVTVDGSLSGKVLKIEVVNSASCPFSGTAYLLYHGESIGSEADIKANGKTEICFELTEDQLSHVSFGTNKASLIIGNTVSDFTFESRQSTMDYNVVALDDNMLVPRDFWFNCTGKIGGHRSHMFLCRESVEFMEGLFENESEINILPGVPVRINKNGFIPLDSETNRYTSIPLKGLSASKVYILLSSFITNHNVFSEVFRIELECERDNEAYYRPIVLKPLMFPGDLDMAYPGKCNFGFPTYVTEEPRGERPALPAETGTDDYSCAVPPSYPQHYLWTRNKTIETGNTVFNLIEINLNTLRNLKELRISVTETVASGGVFAITVAK